MTNVQFVRHYPAIELSGAMWARARQGRKDLLVAGTEIQVLQVSVSTARTPGEVLAGFDESIVEFSLPGKYQVYWAHVSDFADDERQQVRTALEARLNEMRDGDGNEFRYIDNFIVRWTTPDDVEAGEYCAYEELAMGLFRDLIKDAQDKKLTGRASILRQLDLVSKPRKFHLIGEEEFIDGEMLRLPVETNTFGDGIA